METAIRFAIVGVANTFIHWSVLRGLCMLNIPMKTGNPCAFAVAVSFSFFANAAWTFNATPTLGRYVAFVALMGTLAFLVGLGADKVRASPLVTTLFFTAISFVFGFLIANFFVFSGAS